MLAATTAVNAQVYKRCDKNGVCSYSDQPQNGAEQVEINAVVSEFTAPVKGATTAPSLNPSDPLADVTATTYIISPQQKEAIRANDGSFQVSWGADIVGLASTPIYELWVDQQPVYKGPLTQVTLRDVDRGERRLQVRVYAADDTQLARSDITVVYVLRASVIKPPPGS